MPTLRLLRRIDPTPDLRTYLEAAGQIEDIEDKSRRVWSYVDDAKPREIEWTDEIVSRCTLGFAILDEENTIHGYYTRLDKAVRALDGAKVVLQVDVDVDDSDDEEDVTPEEDTAPGAEKRKAVKAALASV